MPSYLRKKYKRDEKKMVSTRVRTYVLDAFQNAAEDANKNGYILSLSEVVETALIHAISEYTKEQEVDFLQVEIDKMEIERQKQQEKEDQEQWEKDLELADIHMKEMMDLDYKEMEKANSEAYERKRLEQLEKDKNALLTLNPAELKKYQDKRKKETAEEEKKMKEFRKKLEARLKIDMKKKDKE
jgi:hypothetical protein